MQRVASQLEAFILSTKVTLTVLLCSSLFHIFTYTNRLRSIKGQHKKKLQKISVLCCFPSSSSVIYLCHFCSRTSDQWQSVQFSARTTVRQTNRFRILSGLCGPFRVQPRLSVKRIKCNSLPGCPGCPCTVERNNTNLYRWGRVIQFQGKVVIPVSCNCLETSYLFFFKVK